MSKDNNDVKKLYDQKADTWIRGAPTLFTDFYGRPELLENCLSVDFKTCLDLGCGEGYFTRLLLKAGAKKVFGVDISDAMIERAEKQKTPDEMESLIYSVADISKKEFSLPLLFDFVSACFVLHYIDSTALEQLYINVEKLMNKNARFCFSVPHPSFLASDQKNHPIYFDRINSDYLASRNLSYNGFMSRTDGATNQVIAVHKTLEDYINLGLKAGLQLTKCVELCPTKEKRESLNKAGFSIPETLKLPYFLILEFSK